MMRWLVLGCATTLLLATPVRAQEPWPARPVRVVVPFLAGGGADVVARAMAQALGERLGRPFVVENRPGGAGNVGTEAVARAAPDGYTLLVTGPNHATNPHLFARLPFDAVRDFAPVSLLTAAPYVLVADPALPLRGFADLVTLARARPGALSYGSSGNGSAGHLAMEMIKTMTGIDMVHVPYRGSPPVLVDLMAGRIAVALDNVLSSSPGIAAGQLRALAVSAGHRAPTLPDVPTLAEQGLAGFDVTVWQAALFPAGVDPAIVARASAEIAAGMRAPAVRQRMADIGAEAIGGTPAELATFLAAEMARWGVVIRASGARLD
jgi:tripartite-type tricarboxylate transporter receptor subunit TctC